MNNVFTNGYEMRAIEANERAYTYKQSQQLDMQTGIIGYVRADLGSLGTEFFHTWNEYRKDLNTPEFKSELDAVIGTLRKDGNFLSSRDKLTDFCNQNYETSYNNDREFGVRVNTPQYAFLMRLNPSKGEYNLYCYCYRKLWLDAHIEKAKRGIRFIDPHYNEKFRLADGDEIIIRNADGSFDNLNGLRNSPQRYVVRYIDDYHLEYGRNLAHICEFAGIMEKNSNVVIPLRASLPEQCYVYIQSENKIGIVNKGEQGYTDSKASGNNPDENRKLVDEMNNRLKVTKAQAEAMKAGSMFGWHTPAADPKNYDENGKAIHPKNKDIER